MRVIKYAEWNDMQRASHSDGYFYVYGEKDGMSYSKSLYHDKIYKYLDHYISRVEFSPIRIPFEDSAHSFLELEKGAEDFLLPQKRYIFKNYIHYFKISDMTKFASANSDNEIVMSQMNIIYEDEYNYYKNKATNEIFNSIVKNSYQYDDIELKKQLTKAVDIDMINYIKSQKGF